MKKKTRGRPLKHNFSKMKPGKWYAYDNPNDLKGFRRTFQVYVKENGLEGTTRIAYDKLWLCII
jgi:hypothetical protein